MSLSRPLAARGAQALLRRSGPLSRGYSGIARALPATARAATAVPNGLLQQRSFRTSFPALATQQFKLADIGEGIAEVTVTEWFVKEGDMVKEMDNICAVESDKASVELTSPYTGKITKINYKLQDVVKVGSVLIEVESDGGAPAEKPAAKAPAAKPAGAAAAAAPAAGGGGVKTFKLADIGEGIAEVQLTEWFVKEGDVVKEMDNLCSVESDKASVELTSPYSGKVKKLYAKVSDTVKVGSALVDIEDGSSPAASASKPAASSASAPSPVSSGGGGGVKEFKLADIGEGIAEVQLTEWMVKEGQQVKEMDVLCSVESDKASVELTSPFTGTIKKLSHSQGSTVKVGSTLVEIETAGGGQTVDSTPPAATPSTPAPAAAPAAKAAPAAASKPASSGSGVKAPGVLATPKVRHLAKTKGVDLNTVAGSGASGRVLESDVLAALETSSSSASSASSASSTASTTASSSAPASPSAAAPSRPVVRPGEERKIEITDGVGKGMVKSMIEALQMPTMSLGEEIDMTEMIRMQKALKGDSEKLYGVKVTLTSFMVKAMSLALTEYPKVNSKFGPSDAQPPFYTQYGSHNISIAVDTPGGLVVPNIKDVANLNIIEIQNEVKRLAADAQANKLKMADIQGGTITLSNIGVIGTTDPSPIPFAGQSVIGATGRTMKLPRYNDKMELVPRDIMVVRWVGDHRHLDGATLARFSNAFKKYMEEPGQWMLTLR